MDATTVAVDLAKDIFEVACANRAGRVIERKRLTRRQFERFVDNLEAGTDVIMEACGTAHYWGRRCQARGLRVRLLPPQTRRCLPTLLAHARCPGGPSHGSANGANGVAPPDAIAAMGGPRRRTMRPQQGGHRCGE